MNKYKSILVIGLLTTIWLAPINRVFGQQRIVSGQIISIDGEAIPGANIVIKGTTIGTTSDRNGNYRLEITAPTDTLVFSFIGYETVQEHVGNRSTIDIVLEESTEFLEDLVVIGYGETAKRKFTGSLESINADDIAQKPLTSPIQVIQGRSAGVLVEDGNGEPGSQGSIVIRGVGTLNQSTEPLYVVDGTPTTSLSSINPNDIETISILKDATATSIYGSRASNGVIIIETKKGKLGETEFTVNVQSGFSDIENPNDFRMMNATEYKNYYREAYQMNGENPDDPTSGFYLPADADSINTDWVDAVTRVGKAQLYEITASRGTEDSRLYSSASYYNQQGVVVGTQFERFSGRINYSLTPVQNFNIDLNLMGAYTKEDLQFSDSGRSGTFAGAFNVNPTASPFANASTPISLSGKGYNYNLPSNANHNPIASNDINFNNRDQIRAFPTLKLTYDPLDNLTISSSGSIDYRVRKRNSYQSKFYFAETDNGLAESQTEIFTDANFNLTALYNYEVNSDHTLSPLIGFEFFKSRSTLEEFGSRDFAFDNVNNVAFGSIPLGREYDFFGNTITSFFSRLNYSFKEKLFLEATFRRDGSSRFGPENRWGNFYAFGAGYHLISEDFMQSQDIISDLKLRASYGIQGNNAIGDFAWRGTYNTNGQYIVPPIGGGSGVPNAGAQPSSPENETLKWEQSSTLNFGIDFGLINDRITGVVEYYKRSSIDLLTPRLISQTSGFSSIIDNIGDVENKGVEVSLNTRNLEGQNLTWDTNFNISFNKNKIVELNGAADTLFATTDGSIIRIVGQPLDQWYLPEYAGVDPGTGQAVYYAENGSLTGDINEARRVIAGQTNLTPDYYGSLSNTIKYKGLTLSFMFYFKSGFKVYRQNLQELSLPSGNNQPASNLDRWQQPGDITNIPRANSNYAQFNSTRWIEDGAFIRLRDVSLAYMLPDNFNEKLGVSDMTLILRGINVLTFTEFGGFNPDVGNFEDDDFPLNRNITLGLSLKF